MHAYLGQLHLDHYQYHTGEEIYPHSNLWGEFNFALDGTLDIQIAQHTYLSPPNYAIWIPPHHTHQAIAHFSPEIHYICFRVSAKLSSTLAHIPQTVQINPLISLLTQSLLQQNSDSISRLHKLMVLYDEFSAAPRYQHYLPMSNHAPLQDIIDFLLLPQHHALKLHTICNHFMMSERHLLRLFQQHLNMSISEWRNRAKLIYVIEQLKQDCSIKKIALDLGYQHASALIEFFKRYTQMTPEKFRQHQFLR